MSGAKTPKKETPWTAEKLPKLSRAFELIVWRRIRLRATLLFVEDGSGRGIQEKPGSTMVGPEVEHGVQRAGNRVRGTIADTAQIPVVFDEAKDGRLVGHTMIDVVLPCERGNYQQGLPRPISATAILNVARSVDRLGCSAVARPEELVIGDVRLVHNRTHHMVVPS